jgi:HAD superfamily hydrolase (TIGR01509 family)
MQPITGVIFDCDGTIVDSRDLIVPFYNWLFVQVGLEPIDTNDPVAYDIVLSRSDSEVFDHFVPDPADRKKLWSFMEAFDFAEWVTQLKLEPHAMDVLTALRPHYRLAIATNRGRDMALLVRHFGFDERVDTVVCAADVTNPKPHPEMLLLAAERIGVAPQHLVYVGDTAVDGEAAAAAGMRFVCYRRGAGAAAERATEAPAMPVAGGGDGGGNGGGCVDDLRHLPGRLLALSGR